MKAEIRFDGTLEISAETELEGYALEKWCENSMPADCEKIVINCEPKINPPVENHNYDESWDPRKCEYHEHCGARFVGLCHIETCTRAAQISEGILI